MKKLILIVLLFTESNFLFAQKSSKEVDNIATFCKVWGFLKYYHPKVATGAMDWDEEFINRVETVKSLNSKTTINNYYTAWILELGTVNICKKCTEVPDSLKSNLDLKWMADTAMFNISLINQLEFIRKNRNQGKNYYVQQFSGVGNTNYDNEKPYYNSTFPSVALRLLGLARYWNIINYFFPYKYKIGHDWSEILSEMIPKFKDSKDTIAYHLAMLELTAKINDSHTFFSTQYTNQYFGFLWTPFKFKIIDNKAIVTGFYNDSLCRHDDIKVGDAFLEIDKVAIKNIIIKQSKYIGASNKPTQIRNMSFAIFNGMSDSINTVFERQGKIESKIIHRYRFIDFKYKKENKEDTCKILGDNIGYINMGLLQVKQVDKFMAKLKATQAIIFDIRNYPNWTLYELAKHLNEKNKPFAKFIVPDLTYAGVFNYTKNSTFGAKNDNYYKGKVILLFDETTQSRAEFTCMALQTAPNVISIGSQTAGADGNVSTFMFPGGYKTSMTGIGVFYPDGKETQRIGIVPDIEVIPTIEGIRMSRDELLEKAIEVINKK